MWKSSVMTMFWTLVVVLVSLSSLGHGNVTQTIIKMGVLLISDDRVPFSVQRVYPAIEIAMETVNTKYLNDSYALESELQVFDNVCNSRNATGFAAKLFYENHVSVFVGPACVYALEGVGRVASFWNVPVITGLGDGGQFKNKTEYSTLTRFSYCQCRLRSVFGSVLKEFGWKDLVIIYDVDDVHSNELGMTLNEGLTQEGYMPIVIKYCECSSQKIQSILQDASKHARVVILILPGDTLRMFMLAAHSLGYPQSGDYVFLDVQLFTFPGPYWGDHDWRRDDDSDAAAREAYDAILRLSLSLSEGDDWQTFAERVQNISQDQFNFTFGSEQVNFFIGAFHDAILHYGDALNKTLSQGGDILDGYTISRYMWNKTFIGVTGEVIIDRNGDRVTNFAILDMNMDTGHFEVVGNFLGDDLNYTHIPGKHIHWPGPKGTPPANRPVCGFKGEDLECQTNGLLPSYMVAILSVLAVSIGLLVASFFVYRRLVTEKELRSMAWRIDLQHIRFRPLRADSSKVCSWSELTSTGTSADTDKQCFTNVAVYQGTRVAVKQIDVERLDISRRLLLEIKTMRDLQHENLARFVGLCLQPKKVYILTEYCPKGSLQDVLLNENIKLDWTFRLSLLTDVIKGMRYIHNSGLQYHGHLTSSNCVVDGRFNLKVTDFGLPDLQRHRHVSQLNNNHEFLEKLLWVAPEHLGKVGKAYLMIGVSQKGDVYSFGIILEEIILRSLPFDTCRGIIETKDILNKVMARESPPFRPKVPAQEAPAGLLLLMLQCWEESPLLRPTFEVIFKKVKALHNNRDVNLVDTLIKRLEEYASNLEDVVEERTLELIEEKKKSEMLLYQILPRCVAEQLRQGKAVVPELHDCVTIYFSDIVGFTTMSADSTPMQVVEFLNDLYSLFDSVIENYDVYKVETIGDAYMVVSGLPQQNRDSHAAEICRMALQLLVRTQTFHIRHRPQDHLLLRIGVHSGPCCAGVVGLKMPRYCLFGDTVNTASRMESTGEALKIHVSSSTKEILDKYGTFVTELRGQVKMKGKGMQTTYWLLRENPELSSQTAPETRACVTFTTP